MPQAYRANMEEITGQEAFGLRAQEGPPRGVEMSGAGPTRRECRMRRTVASLT
jgi:hypothetical protein